MRGVDLNSLKSLLLRWQSEAITAHEVHSEAEALMAECDWKELPKDDPESPLYEVLCQLDILNQQLILSEDVPVFLTFLGSKESDLEERWSEWEGYWRQVDFERRRRELQGSDFYAV